MAGKGIAERRGVGKIRHLDTQYLWVQQKLQQKAFTLKKVKGTENPADLQTKYVGGQDIEKQIERLGFAHLDGSSSLAKRAAV